MTAQAGKPFIPLSLMPGGLGGLGRPGTFGKPGTPGIPGKLGVPGNDGKPPGKLDTPFNAPVKLPVSWLAISVIFSSGFDATEINCVTSFIVPPMIFCGK
ncbi:MAG: hypothetical protein EB059_10190 [Alphaproteobacteria bacterium]|nr:hypothetical protein [Alphaproteobacteria bacterium]